MPGAGSGSFLAGCGKEVKPRSRRPSATCRRPAAPSNAPKPPGIRPPGDELDELGGICTFTRPRQLFYIADALAWIPSQAPQAQDYAARAIDAYTDTSTPEWSFADAAGSRCDLAVARITGGEPDGAREAIAPVLDLPPGQRIHAIVVGVQHVHTALRRPGLPTAVRELQEEIEDFTAIPLRALPS